MELKGCMLMRFGHGFFCLCLLQRRARNTPAVVSQEPDNLDGLDTQRHT